MPDLFSPYTLKGVTLRNRIAMSPMTMYRSVDGKMTDFHVMLLGSRAAGGFGLVFPEQIAITPDGRTGTHCAGIYDDAQIESLSRVTTIIKDMGAVPAIQLGHTGRKGSEMKPWEGKRQLPPTHPDGWQVRGPSAIPYGGRYTYPVQELTVTRSRTSTAPMQAPHSGPLRRDSSGWRCISRTVISARASFRRWLTNGRTSTAAAWRTGFVFTERLWTRCERCGRSVCR
jgi:NADH:flavin oxidoreductase/NADH oxidase family protein